MLSPFVHQDWPVSFSDLITIGNKTASAGIVTLWTKKEFVLQHLNPSQYALVGQLYSRHEGLNALLRNCLANTHIRHLLLTGTDLNKSGEALLCFFLQGVTPAHTIQGVKDVLIDKEIPLSSLELLRSNIQIHDYRSLKDFSQLPQLLETFPVLPPYAKAEIYPTTKIVAPEIYPSEKSGFVVHEEHIGPAWFQILQLISRFGMVKQSDYNEDQRELLNIITVINKEDPDHPKFYPYFQFTNEDIFAYYPQIISSNSLEGIEYSYGQRLRAQHDKDQIRLIAETLQKTPYTRRAIAVTWDLATDLSSEKPPCLILVQFLVQNAQLFMTAFFRSNDMFQAWPRNAFGLRKLQSTVAQELGMPLGALTIISHSAHIYAHDWKLCQEILQKHSQALKHIGDPRGNIIIRVTGGKIIVTHTAPDGRILEEFSGTDISSFSARLALDKKISEISHALYIGTELQKARIALENGLPYIQDQPLVFP